jgi:peptidoglycan/LPS O-acetylase OafA/YrhL
MSGTVVDHDAGVVVTAPDAAHVDEVPRTGDDLAVRERYRPFLDGLRAIAVYLVVLFHAGSDRFAGGYVGVDVFFVLSGFLVTQLLVRDVVGRGGIDFARFYSRRFRRLLPAALVVLVVTAVVFRALASPVEVADAAGGLKAALLYVTNWFFIDQSTQYFGGDVSANPVLHFWSLAVEEQFYLLWPLLLGGLVMVARRFGRSQWRIVRVVVAVGGVASLVWALSLRESDPNRAYYGTDARAYQLLAGALLALSPVLIGRLGRFARGVRLAGAAALAGVVVVGSSWLALDAIERGAVVAALTVMVIAALEASGGPLARLLSVEPVVYLGKVSYGTYLWHWPVIIVIDRAFDLSVMATVAMTVLVATALASLSFQLLERPIRVSALLDGHRRVVIATGLAASVATAVLVVPSLTDPTTSSATADGDGLTTVGFTPVPDGIDWRAIKTSFPEFTSCLDEPPQACTVVEGEGPHILLMGDSHAGMAVPTFDAIARANDLTLSVSVQGGCPWQRDLYVVLVPFVGQKLEFEDCQQLKDDAYDRVIPALDPDVIVVMNLGFEAPRNFIPYLGPDRERQRNGSPEQTAWLEKATRDSLAQLEAGGRKVVILEPIPLASPDTDPLSCLSQAAVVEACRYLANTEPTNLEAIYRRLDRADDDLWSADLDKLVCPYLPICDPIVNHEIVKLDGSHITPPFARSVAPSVTAYLEENGIIPR